MTELTQDNLQEIIAANPLVFVQFGAGWCGNCKIIKPKFKKYAAETPNATFVYVDAAFKNGNLEKQLQTNKAELLKEFIDEITGN